MDPDTFVHPTAEVDPEAQLGDGVMVWNWSKICKGASIGDRTKIGQGVYIDLGVKLGDACKVQNGVSIYRGVTVEDRVFVGPHATFTNDLLPRAFGEDWQIVPTYVEEGASIGANATVVCGSRIGAYSMVAAGAVVTSDVPAYALVMGVPARTVDFVTRSGRRLHRNPDRGPPSEEEVFDVEPVAEP